MIPRRIFYFWFGYGEKSRLVKKCIRSWHNYCPDMEIVEYNESNFDVAQNKYCYEAYKAGKWAFVSDYARFKILYEEGGVYLDTDVEFIKPLSFDLNTIDLFAGFSFDSMINPGSILGAANHLPIIKEILDTYENVSFILQESSDQLNVVSRVTPFFRKYGIQLNDKNQLINGIRVFAHDYFDPLNCNTWKINLTKNTISIHHYNGSWYSKENQYFIRVYKKMCKIINSKTAGLISKFITLLHFYGFKYAYKEYRIWKSKK